MLGEREAADLQRFLDRAAKAARECRQCNGQGVLVVDYGSPSQPVHELVCDCCGGTGKAQGVPLADRGDA